MDPKKQNRRKNTVNYQAENLDQLIEQSMKIHDLLEDAEVNVNFPNLMYREFNNMDAIRLRRDIYICPAGLILAQLVEETAKPDKVGYKKNPDLTIESKIKLPLGTLRVTYDILDYFPRDITFFEDLEQNEFFFGRHSSGPDGTGLIYRDRKPKIAEPGSISFVQELKLKNPEKFCNTIKGVLDYQVGKDFIVHPFGRTLWLFGSEGVHIAEYHSDVFDLFSSLSEKYDQMSEKAKKAARIYRGSV